MARWGGEDGLDLVRKILHGATDRLTPNSMLVVEIGRGRKRLEKEFPETPFLWLATSESEGKVLSISRSDLENLGKG